MKMMTDAVAHERITDLQVAAHRAGRIQQAKTAAADRRPAAHRYGRWRKQRRPCPA